MTKTKQFSPHIYQEWGELFDVISIEERSEVLLGIVKFPEYEPKNVSIWNFIKSQIQKDYELYEEKCRKNGEISRNYWKNKKLKEFERISNEFERISNESECISNESERYPKPKLLTGTNNELPIIDNSKKNKFLKPSIDEIKNYCLERNNQINAEQFYDYYESKGWLIGKSKMKDWKAAIRTWERNGFSKPEKQEEEFKSPYRYADTGEPPKPASEPVGSIYRHFN